MYIAPSSGEPLPNLDLPFKWILRRFEVVILMSGVRMLHFLKDWWKFVQIHQSYTMALNLYIRVEIDSNNISNYISGWQ